MDISRRSFIRWVLAAGAASACPVPIGGAPVGGSPSKAGVPEGKLTSEDRTTCHKVRDGEELPVPPPDEKRDLVIVGGGGSGLAAADEAKNADFILLEKEPHLGGNSYTESWEGLRYSTGAAWDSLADPAFPGIAKRFRFDWKPIQGSDSACFDGKWIRDFWVGGVDTAAIEQLPYDKATKDGFRDFLKEAHAVPAADRVDELDAKPFSNYFEGRPPQLRQFWNAFCLSNWGAPLEHTSAYQGLQAVTEWFRDQRYTWEGGIGMASKLAFDGLPEGAKKRVVTGAAVFRVQRKGKKAWVSFFKDGKARTIEARGVVMATPKFITKFLVADLPSDQYEAMAAMRYAPFLVYNLCFDRVVFNQSYDNWVVGAKHFTDFIPADWVTHADGGDLKRKQVITVYAPKLESERHEFQDDALVLAKAKEAVSELVGGFPGWIDSLREVRIYRRGHPMPMSIPGFFTKLQPVVRRDLAPIYFAHSDSKGSNSDWLYAAINGIDAAKKALKKV
ncbi:MAG: FAD-dependent oxidoreductase [Elusimicrobia bacterium]|nr:FAD-dependent oxidoreductase [Elusimicrobiota bacterium]